jgi:MFS family permease
LNSRKRLLMVTILVIALVQMPQLALMPAINLIQTTAFPEQTLLEIQSAMAWTSLVSPLTSILVALFINRAVATKKGAVVVGLLLLGLTGLLAVLFHSQFWHLKMLSVCIGAATGCFMTNNFGLMFDNFDDSERQVVAGYHTSCVNAGGILLALTGGVLATVIWYGAYLLLLIGFPIALLAFFAVPNYKSPGKNMSGDAKVKTKLHQDVFYYAILASLFMMIYGVCSNNISTHIKDLGNSATAGIATSIQMAGGVVSGLLFGKLSEKLRDMLMVVACALVFIGYMLLSLFASSLPVIFVGVFLTGTSLSLMLPRCIYSVSTRVDAHTSATATVIVSSVAPSTGGFLSPHVFTKLTVELFGQSTVARFMFVGFIVFVFGLLIALNTLRRAKKEKARLASI